MQDVRCVAPVGDQCGEAATWSPEEHAIYWTDVNRFLVHRMDPDDGAVRTWHFDEPCVALFLTEEPGALILALGSRLILWRWRNDAREDWGFAYPGWPKVRLNDGRAGPRGEIFIGSMANNVGRHGTPGELDGFWGELWRLAPGETPQVLKRDIGISNTVCWSPDGTRLYFGDSPRNVIWRYDYDPATGDISNETPFFEGFARGKPDGSTVDADGFLWNARFGGGCVVRVAPDGAIDRVVEMPVTNLTTCEFGGRDLKTLFITSCAMLVPGYERLMGSLFALDCETPGVAPRKVKGRPGLAAAA